MNFKNILKSHFQSNETHSMIEAEKVQTSCSEDAVNMMSTIKELLIRQAEIGNTDLHHEVSCKCPFPDRFQWFLITNDRSWDTPSTPSGMSSMSSMMIGKSKKETHMILKQYRGKISSPSIAAVHHISIELSINTECQNEYELICKKLSDYAKQDGIEISFFAIEKATNILVELPYVVSDRAICRMDYELCALCKCTIPEKYSYETEEATPVSDLSGVDEEVVEQSGYSLKNIDVMDGHAFEHICAELLIKNGYSNVEVTQGSGDQGVDILAYRDGIKYGIQCKCYSSDIGNKAIQEVFAGKAYYKCHVGIVLTNKYFTKSAIDLANSNGIVLWNRDDLASLISVANANIKRN